MDMKQAVKMFSPKETTMLTGQVPYYLLKKY
jgi:hypothetical protein